MVFMIDTNACIRFLERRSESLREKFLLVPKSQKVLCSIVVAELLFGAAKSKRKDQTLSILLPFIQRFRVLDFDLNAAHHFAEIRAELAAQGRPIGPYDLQIAAISRANNLTLVTNNVAEFGRVSNLSIADWERAD
jgi:tRNA(fMet)-specific endonuclease VapC